MKVMNKLTLIATDFFNLYASELNAENRALIGEFIECGEEGIAVDYLMKWAIDNDVVIPDRVWRELSEYFAPFNTDSCVVTKRLIDTVAHAA